MKVCQPKVMISGFDKDEFEEIMELLIFLGCCFNVFEVNGEKRIEVFKTEF